MGNSCNSKGNGIGMQSVRRVVPNHTVPADLGSSSYPNSCYLSNEIRTTKYSILSFLPKNLFEQFHRFANLYFIFIVLLNFVPAVNAVAKEVAALPVLFVLSVTAIKDGFEDYRRYKSDKKINNQYCRIYSKNEGKYVKVHWKDVRVGDIVHLSCNEVIPADIILIKSSDDSGMCHIDTANLDGENNLKQRQVVKGLNQGPEFRPTMFTHTLECEIPNREIYKFHGKLLSNLGVGDIIPVDKENILLRGCVLMNTDYVEGIVVYAGHDTKALLNNRGPRYKRSQLEIQINRDVVWCVIILFLMCFGCSVGTGLFFRSHKSQSYVPYLPVENLAQFNIPKEAFIRFWTYIILFQVMIPLSLYFTIEVVKLGQAYFLQLDKELYHEASDKRMQCKALNITEDLGQVQYIFSDKTGTLTENQMIFKRCTIGGKDYYPPSPDESVPNENSNNGNLPAPVTPTTPTSPTSLDGAEAFKGDTIMTDLTLHKYVSTMSVNSVGLGEASLSAHTKQIQDFFLILSVCNTVVVSKHGHIDQMDASGVVHDGSYMDPMPQDTPHSVTGSRLLGSSTYNLRVQTPAREPATPLLVSYKRLTDTSFDSQCSSPGPHSPSLSHDKSFTEAITTLHYEAESPDELALVKAAFAYGCILLKRTPEKVVMKLPAGDELTVKVLAILPFDSARKRMSVIIEKQPSKEIVMYTKGADSAILNHLKKGQGTAADLLHAETEKHLTEYAKKGLRTLCMAKRVLTREEFDHWYKYHEMAAAALDNRENLVIESACNIEKELELIGATGIEDRLQDGVPETIQSLRQAGIKVWVLTGDKQETALNIAYSCKLFSFDQDIIIINARSKPRASELLNEYTKHLEDSRIGPSSPLKKEVALVIDGETLKYALSQDLEKTFLNLAQYCNSVLCCRATPHQKAAVVKLVRDKLKMLTLAIGDGANDVSMIQTADVGIGISGQEGMQAVMSSDFAIGRFKFLKRLLLVHGHWCYDRLARMTLYMFYKNAVFIFMLLWFQIYNGWSGSHFLDDLNLLLFNLVYTSLPAFSMGIFDKDVSAATLMAFPQLYIEGAKSKTYTRYSYFLSILDAVWQSLVELFIPFLFYYGSNVGMWEFGVTCNAGCVYVTLLHTCMEVKTWNIFHGITMLLSVLLFFICNVAFGVICVQCQPPANPYMVFQHTLATPRHWLCVVMVIALALIPRYAYKALAGSLKPSAYEIAAQWEKGTNENEKYSAMWSSESSSASVIVSSEVTEQQVVA